jgi:selenide,water dikinase
MEEASIKLTSLSSCAGCAAKLGQALLQQFVGGIVQPTDRNVLIGSATSDDAAVYRVNDELALVQTVDFFTPIVDDPYVFGQIAAANALSDVYAMGGRPMTAMNLLGVPTDKVPPAAIARILAGGAEKVVEAGCSLVGGHTIRSAEPIYGLSVTGFVNPGHVMSNTAARVGDLLVLTKPIGTGIITTAIKQGFASAAAIEVATNSMRQLNTAGAELAEKGLVRCATDVTGFGLLGHMANIARGSGVTLEIIAADVPVLTPEVLELIGRNCVPGGTRTNLQAAEAITDFGDLADDRRVPLADAQTSGGLLLCVAPANLAAVREVLRRHHSLAEAVIGSVVSKGQPRIAIRS